MKKRSDPDPTRLYKDMQKVALSSVDCADARVTDGRLVRAAHHGQPVDQPHIPKSMPFDPEDDIAPVTQVVNAPCVLLVNATLPVESAKEHVSYAKHKPGEINFASSRATAPSDISTGRCSKVARASTSFA